MAQLIKKFGYDGLRILN